MVQIKKFLGWERYEETDVRIIDESTAPFSQI
jgi:hypothetical protein